MLKWSEPANPVEGVSYYDHVAAETPLGTILIEWKSWKDFPSYTAGMPWGNESGILTFICADSLDDAKDEVQKAWDAMAARVQVEASR